MSSFREPPSRVVARGVALRVIRRTSSKGERLEEYLAIPSLPDLTEEEVKLIDDVGRTHFFHTYVSSLRVRPVSRVDESIVSPVHTHCWIVRSQRISRRTEVTRCIGRRSKRKDSEITTIKKHGVHARQAS
jgi:hypothetical protein